MKKIILFLIIFYSLLSNTTMINTKPLSSSLIKKKFYSMVINHTNPRYKEMYNFAMAFKYGWILIFNIIMKTLVYYFGFKIFIKNFTEHHYNLGKFLMILIGFIILYLISNIPFIFYIKNLKKNHLLKENFHKIFIGIFIFIYLLEIVLIVVSLFYINKYKNLYNYDREFYSKFLNANNQFSLIQSFKESGQDYPAHLLKKDLNQYAYENNIHKSWQDLRNSGLSYIFIPLWVEGSIIIIIYSLCSVYFYHFNEGYKQFLQLLKYYNYSLKDIDNSDIDLIEKSIVMPNP